MFFRLGGRNVHVPKLIGAFLIVAAVLLFVKAGADMFESWDNAKFLNSCLENASSSLSLEGKQMCQQSAYYAGQFVRLDQKALTSKQTWSMLLGPIAGLFLWAIALIIGLMLYLSGRIIIPIEEAERLVKERIAKSKVKGRK
jgi:hypothetical protein